MAEAGEALRELAARVQRIEDRLEIRELAVRYCIAIDDQDYAVLASLYAYDATMSTREGPVRGREAVVDFLRRSRERQGRTIHIPEAHIVAFTGEDTAFGTVLGRVELGMTPENLVGAARYTDSYVRENGRWCFASRELRFVHLGTWRERGDALSRPDPVRWP